jgi:hypothetical protein
VRTSRPCQRNRVPGFMNEGMPPFLSTIISPHHPLLHPRLGCIATRLLPPCLTDNRDSVGMRAYPARLLDVRVPMDIRDLGTLLCICDSRTYPVAPLNTFAFDMRLLTRGRRMCHQACFLNNCLPKVERAGFLVEPRAGSSCGGFEGVVSVEVGGGLAIAVVLGRYRQSYLSVCGSALLEGPNGGDSKSVSSIIRCAGLFFSGSVVCFFFTNSFLSHLNFPFFLSTFCSSTSSSFEVSSSSAFCSITSPTFGSPSLTAPEVLTKFVTISRTFSAISPISSGHIVRCSLAPFLPRLLPIARSSRSTPPVRGALYSGCNGVIVRASLVSNGVGVGSRLKLNGVSAR